MYKPVFFNKSYQQDNTHHDKEGEGRLAEKTKTGMIALIVLVGLSIIGAVGYLIHHLTTGQMNM